MSLICQVEHDSDAGIQQILDWASQLSHIRIRKEKKWLLNFLRHCKFDVEHTKQLIEYFYSLKDLAPELTTCKDPLLPDIQDILSRGISVLLPKPVAVDGPVVGIIRFKCGNPSLNYFVDIVKTQIMATDILLNENDNFRIFGIEIIQDFEYYPFNYVFQFSPELYTKIFKTLLEAYPIKVHRIHCINAPSYLNSIVNVAKPFLSEKVRDKIKVYTTDQITELYNFIPREILPLDYGGDEESCEKLAAKWKAKIEGYQEWYLDDKQYGPIKQ